MASAALKETLLRASMQSESNANNPQQGRGQVSAQHDGSSDRESRERRRRAQPGRIQFQRKVILRLAVALHTYGSSAPRTEHLIERAAERLGVPTSIAVFPSLLLIAFTPVVGHHNCCLAEAETHLLKVEADLDLDKLGRADELANLISGNHHHCLLAFWRLKAIATAPPEFGKWWRLASFAFSSGSAALLFFNGNLWDGVLGFLLGLLVGALDWRATSSSLFSNVLEFVAALLVSFIVRLIDVYLKKLRICFFAVALSSMVWLLPGLSLTIGVSELVAKSFVTGSARMVYAMFSALQLGFGLAIGENLVFWAPKALKAECPTPDLSPLWNILWFFVYTASSNVLLNARWDQWPGMTLASLAGYVVTVITAGKLDESSSSVAAAFAIGITGTAYSIVSGHLPLSMVLSGILLLVPGGFGVKGMAAMMDKDILSGMSFVFQMLVIGLSITIGLLLAKLVLPVALFGAHRAPTHNKESLAAQMAQEERVNWEEDEEHMAI